MFDFNCFLSFPIPWVGAEFCVSFIYDFTFWLHLAFGAFLSLALLVIIFDPVGTAISSTLFHVGYEIAKGTCDQGMNLMDLSGSLIGMAGVVVLIVYLDRKK